jgi:hypothetical protein
VSLQEKVLEFEIELTQFIVDNHLSFLIGEKMIKFMKKYCDYEVVTAASLNDEKISRIIRECVKPILVNTLNEKLANVLFSLSCDETTHMASNKKYFAIMIQFYDEKLTKLRSYLHTFEATQKSDADSLYQVLANQILEKNIANNVIGISMDNASINKGSENSISTHIQAKYPYVWVNYCICHSYNLVCKYASKAIPESVEKFIHSMYNYFSKSPMKSADWLQLQRDLGVTELKISKYVETRWLSEEFFISRILSRWKELIQYFSNETTKSGTEIFNYLEETEIKVYLQFLKIFLREINRMNTKFQMKERSVCIIEEYIRNLFNQMINLILKDDSRTMSINEKLNLCTKNNANQLNHLISKDKKQT